MFSGQELKVDLLIYFSVHVNTSITQGRLKFWGKGLKFQGCCFQKYVIFDMRHIIRQPQEHAFYLQEVKKLFRKTEVEGKHNILTISVHNS